jgi:Ca2+-binding RTX toxin-like protein
MAGKADFIINGSFERQEGGDAAAWIDRGPQFDPAGDGRTYQFRGTVTPLPPPDGWTVTRGFFGLETTVAPEARVSWDGKVWGLSHEGTVAQDVRGLTAGTVYDLAFIAFHPEERSDPSTLQVFWNGQKVADFASLHAEEGRVTHVLVTAADGPNHLELRTTGVVIIDDVRLFTAGPAGLADFSLSTQPLGVNLGDAVFNQDFPGIPDLPVLSALHAYVGGVAQPLNGIKDLIGGSGNDLLVAAPQGGTIEGRAGADALIGGAGADTMMGGVGNDFVLGGAGRGYLRGDEGDDYIMGGADFDDINGNMGADTCISGGGDDWVVGGKDNDSLSGSAGANLAYGNLGNDTCDGGAGDDIIRGGQDNDVVLGGAGADFVSGDRGDDTMTGGAGADVFHTFGDAGIDRVTDFSLAQGDRVQLDPGTQFAVSQSGEDTVINMSGGGQMILVGVQMSTLTPGWIFGV